MNHLAFYHHKDGKKPTMNDYMEELQVFVREPLIMVHELFATFWERGELDDSPKIEAAMGTLWSCLLRWEALNEFFEDEMRKAHGIKERCFTRSSAERRLVDHIQTQAMLLPEHMKAWLKMSLFSVEDQVLFHGVIKKVMDDKEAEETARETSEEAIEYAEAVMAA